VHQAVNTGARSGDGNKLAIAPWILENITIKKYTDYQILTPKIKSNLRNYVVVPS
jgi:hypothetical protein